MLICMLNRPVKIRLSILLVKPMICEMKSIVFLLLPLLLTTSMIIASDLTEYEGDVTDVQQLRHVDQQPDSWRVWQPFITQWKKNHLIVAFGAMTNGKKDMGDIFAMVSRNDGDTWDEPIAVFDHKEKQGDIQFGYANPVLFKPSDQNVVWCFAMRCSIKQENSEESHLVGAFTADGGRSWTQVELAVHYTGPLITNAGLVETVIDGKKRFLLPAHRNTLGSDPRGSRDHFVLSSSSLLEWELEAYIPQPTKARVFLHEGNMAPWGDDLKIVMRTANYDETNLTTDPPRAYSSISRDGGHTWTEAKAEPELHNAKSKGFFDQASDRGHIYVYSDGPAQRDFTWPYFPQGGRTSLRYKTKDAGSEWSEQKTFFHMGVKNSYPTLFEVAPGDWRAVWDSGTETQPRTRILFGKLKLQ